MGMRAEWSLPGDHHEGFRDRRRLSAVDLTLRSDPTDNGQVSAGASGRARSSSPAAAVAAAATVAVERQ